MQNCFFNFNRVNEIGSELRHQTPGYSNIPDWNECLFIRLLLSWMIGQSFQVCCNRKHIGHAGQCSLRKRVKKHCPIACCGTPHTVSQESLQLSYCLRMVNRFSNVLFYFFCGPSGFTYMSIQFLKLVKYNVIQFTAWSTAVWNHPKSSWMND